MENAEGLDWLRLGAWGFSRLLYFCVCVKFSVIKKEKEGKERGKWVFDVWAVLGFELRTLHFLPSTLPLESPAFQEESFYRMVYMKKKEKKPQHFFLPSHSTQNTSVTQ
jgi:hypothetical protein